MAFDGNRAKAADELAWADFETRMRGIVKKVVDPALELTVESREKSIEMEMTVDKLVSRM